MMAGTIDKKCSTADSKVCGNCFKSAGSAGAPKLSACSRCGLVAYCNRECQRAHWKANHKQRCIAKADRVPEHPQRADGSKDAASKSAAASGIECAICLDPLTDASATTLPCDHKFHSTCVNELRKFGVMQVCPLCRTPLSPGPEKTYEEAARRYITVQRLVERGYASWDSLPAPAQQDIDTALSEWRAAAEEGHAQAQLSLGAMYSADHAVAPDDFEATRWFKMAAEQGCARGQYSFGAQIVSGRGVKQSYAEAARWYRMAAMQGHMDAQCDIGHFYMEGLGVEQNDVEAVVWFTKAAEQGFARAQSKLGIMYDEGRGVDQSTAAALL